MVVTDGVREKLLSREGGHCWLRGTTMAFSSCRRSQVVAGSDEECVMRAMQLDRTSMRVCIFVDVSRCVSLDEARRKPRCCGILPLIGAQPASQQR